VHAVRSDGVREEVGDDAIGSGMTTGTPPTVLRPKGGLPRDGVSDGDCAASREAMEAPKEAASMARCRGRRRRRGWENWAA
jgi:hypothetical protein